MLAWVLQSFSCIFLAERFRHMTAAAEGGATTERDRLAAQLAETEAQLADIISASCASVAASCASVAAS